MNKNYFIKKNDIDKIINIYYSVDKYNIINDFLHMVNFDDLKNILVILKDQNNISNFIEMSFDYCTLIVSKTKVELIIDVFGNVQSCIYYDDEFKNVLSDYIEEYEKMMNEEVGLSK